MNSTNLPAELASEFKATPDTEGVAYTARDFNGVTVYRWTDGAVELFNIHAGRPEPVCIPTDAVAIVASLLVWFASPTA